jgi:hypothetical protein
MKPRTFCLFIIGCLCLAAGVSGAQKKNATLHTFQIRSPRDLRELLSYGATRVPLVSRVSELMLR